MILNRYQQPGKETFCDLQFLFGTGSFVTTSRKNSPVLNTACKPGCNKAACLYVIPSEKGFLGLQGFGARVD